MPPRVQQGGALTLALSGSLFDLISQGDHRMGVAEERICALRLTLCDAVERLQSLSRPLTEFHVLLPCIPCPYGKDKLFVFLGGRGGGTRCSAVVVVNLTHYALRLAGVIHRGHALADQVFAFPAFIFCHARSTSSSLVRGRVARSAFALILLTSSALSLIMYWIRSNCSCVTHQRGRGLYPAARSARAAGPFSSLPLLTVQAFRSGFHTRSRRP